MADDGQGVTIGLLVSANLTTIALLFLLYVCYLHLEDYIYCLLYGFLFAEALWPVKLRLKRFLERFGIRIGDFLLSLVLLGVLGFIALFLTLFIGLFAIVDILDFLAHIQSLASQFNISIPKEWVNEVNKRLEDQVHELEKYNETAWYPLVNDTVAYIGQMSAEGQTLSHRTLVNQLWDPEFRAHMTERVQLIMADMGGMTEVQEYAMTSFFTSANFFSTALFQVLSFLSGALDGLSRVVFLISVAQYLLSRDKNMLRTIIGDFTRSNAQIGVYEKELQNILDSAFVYPAGLALSNGFITLILGFTFGIPYCFLATFILVLFTLVPMLGTMPSLALIPFALANGLLWGGAFIVTHILALKMMASWEMQRVWGEMHTDPYLTALLVCLGYSSMGWQAVFLGPLCVGPLAFVYRVFTDDSLQVKAKAWPSLKGVAKGMNLPKKPRNEDTETDTRDSDDKISTDSAINSVTPKPSPKERMMKPTASLAARILGDRSTPSVSEG